MSTKDTTRSRSAKAAAPGKNVRRPAPRREKTQPGPDVVYTQPGPFNRNRFLLQLCSIVAVVLALTFGISLFFTVKHVEVSGMEKYTP